MNSENKRDIDLIAEQYAKDFGNYIKDLDIYAVFEVYSLFHLTDDDLKKVLKSVYDILKENGIYLLSYQVGTTEEFTDEPYLGEKGSKVLYMNYQTDEKFKSLLNSVNFIKIYIKEKIETVEGAINS